MECRRANHQHRVRAQMGNARAEAEAPSTCGTGVLVAIVFSVYVTASTRPPKMLSTCARRGVWQRWRRRDAK
eukprot:5413093-Prymnesium_polylepis.1